MNTNENVDVDLSTFDDDFESAEVREPFEDLPDGKYQVNVETVNIDSHAPKDGGAVVPTVKWKFKVLTGDHAGRLIFKTNYLRDKTAVGFLKNDLVTCGLKIDKLSHLRDNLERLLDLKLAVQVKRTKSKTSDAEYVNVYINKLLDIGGDSDASFTAGAAGAALRAF